MTDEEYDYGVRYEDGSMWRESVSLDYARSEVDWINNGDWHPDVLRATVVRAPARVWEEFE